MLNITNHQSVQFSRSVMSNSLQPNVSQHARPPCPSPTPGVHWDSRPSSQWCHAAISSSVVPFSSCPQSIPASESLPTSQLFASGGQSTRVSALASVLPKKSQGWSPSEWTGWISSQSKGLSRVFSNTTVQKHQFFSAQLSSQSNSHINTWPLPIYLDSWTWHSRFLCNILFTASDLASITSHIHNWVLFLLWLRPFILSGVISPLISNSILGPYWPGGRRKWQPWGVPLSVSYHFAFSYCSWGSQGKNTEMVCHSLLQWTTFCQISLPWPACLGWPSFIEFSFTEASFNGLVSFS